VCRSIDKDIAKKTIRYYQQTAEEFISGLGIEKDKKKKKKKKKRRRKKSTG
jgi:hypothetical protein